MIETSTDAVAASFYRRAVALDETAFRRWVLVESVKALQGQVAIWAEFDQATRTAIRLTIVGARPNLSADVCAVLDQQFSKSRTWENADRSTLFDDGTDAQERLRVVLATSGRDDIDTMKAAAIQMLKPRSSLLALFLVGRNNLGLSPLATERESFAARFSSLAFHALESCSLNYFLHLGRKPLNDNRQAAALVSRSGTVVEAQPQFEELLKISFGSKPHSTVPFSIKISGNGKSLAVPSCDRLRYSAWEDQGLMQLRLWLKTPLDRLSTSERRVAIGVARGLSNKEIARELFLAPASVGTLVMRAAKKVSAASRSDLRNLVHNVSPYRPSFDHAAR